MPRNLDPPFGRQQSASALCTLATSNKVTIRAQIITVSLTDFISKKLSVVNNLKVLHMRIVNEETYQLMR